MKKLVLKLRILTNTSGQDLIEYALMAGFVAVAAGALMPGVATQGLNLCFELRETDHPLSVHHPRRR